MAELLPDIGNLRDQLDAAECDALMLVENLAEERGGWRPAGSWSVAECLDHLARTNHVYLSAMKESAIRGRTAGRFRLGPAVPGFLGRWFVGRMEPPVKAPFRMKSPRSVEPNPPSSLASAFASFMASQDEVRNFLTVFADLDLAAIPFPNPFVRCIRFSLATGLHVIIAHERRHMWQAWRVRRATESRASERSPVENARDTSHMN
jgi:hypothetical protein